VPTLQFFSVSATAGVVASLGLVYVVAFMALCITCWHILQCNKYVFQDISLQKLILSPPKCSKTVVFPVCKPQVELLANPIADLELGWTMEQ
jgi:hypothetical protein